MFAVDLDADSAELEFEDAPFAIGVLAVLLEVPPHPPELLPAALGRPPEHVLHRPGALGRVRTGQPDIGHVPVVHRLHPFEDGRQELAKRLSPFEVVFAFSLALGSIKCVYIRLWQNIYSKFPKHHHYSKWLSVPVIVEEGVLKRNQISS